MSANQQCFLPSLGSRTGDVCVLIRIFTFYEFRSPLQMPKRWGWGAETEAGKDPDFKTIPRPHEPSGVRGELIFWDANHTFKNILFL